MKAQQAIKKILNQEHMTQKDLSQKLNYTKPTSLNTILRTNNPNTESLIKIMDALDYEIILKPKYGLNKAARSVVLNNDGE